MNTNKHFLTVRKESTKKIQELINDLNLYLENRHKLILFDKDGKAIFNNNAFQVGQGINVNITVPSAYTHLYSSKSSMMYPLVPKLL